MQIANMICIRCIHLKTMITKRKYTRIIRQHADIVTKTSPYETERTIGCFAISLNQNKMLFNSNSMVHYYHKERVFPYNVDTLMHLLNVGPLVSYLILSLHKCTSSLSTVKKLSKTKMRQTDVLALMHQNILTSVHRNSKQ